MLLLWASDFYVHVHASSPARLASSPARLSLTLAPAHLTHPHSFLSTLLPPTPALKCILFLMAMLSIALDVNEGLQGQSSQRS